MKKHILLGVFKSKGRLNKEPTSFLDNRFAICFKALSVNLISLIMSQH